MKKESAVGLELRKLLFEKEAGSTRLRTPFRMCSCCSFRKPSGQQQEKQEAKTEKQEDQVEEQKDKEDKEQQKQALHITS